MSTYPNGLGKGLNDIFESCAEREELDLPSGEFVARNGKAFNLTLLVASLVSITVGALLLIFLSEKIGILFLVLGLCLLPILPTMFSYKCIINKTIMREEYLVLCWRRRREISWSDVKYRKIIIGNNKSIKLYDTNKKRLISFDSTTVGFNRILKLAKRSWIVDLQKSLSQKVK